ncbi:hypothetical protein [Tolypothrix sp. NIES-4075]|uniref:hypothetical protein n=1 Tax=Tolypothrix sp. NIES-4075 TaxID=2005459 RepID=UPI00135A4BA5|nr:hypothetical protein [Tolypothrix sp. NIES-4075]
MQEVYSYKTMRSLHLYQRTLYETLSQKICKSDRSCRFAHQLAQKRSRSTVIIPRKLQNR